MVLKNERAELQQSVIDDLNDNLDKATEERLLRPQENTTAIFSIDTREYHFFKTDKWAYSVSVSNPQLKIYSITRSNCLYEVMKNVILDIGNGKQAYTEYFSITPTAHASKNDLNYVEPYKNHIVKRTGFSRAKKECLSNHRGYFYKTQKTKTENNSCVVVVCDGVIPVEINEIIEPVKVDEFNE